MNGNEKISNSEEIITASISKEELASLVDDIVTPFYNNILADNRVRNFIKEEIFFGLKIKQTKFILKVLTQRINTLKEDFDAMNRTHGRIGLRLDPFMSYFRLWETLLLEWLKSNKDADADTMERWKLKIDTFFDYVRRTYPAPEEVTQEAAKTGGSTEEMPDLKAMVQKIHEEQVRNKISASDFLEQFDYDPTIIDELAEVESDTIDMLFHSESLDAESMKKVEKLLLDYALLLDNTYEFKELAFALSNLCEVLVRSDETLYEAKTQQKVTLFIDGIISDLKNWRIHVFVERDALDVHYLDASLFSSIAQLDVLITSSKHDTPADDEEELELF